MRLPRGLRWLRLRREAEHLLEELEHHRASIQADLESRGMQRDEAAAASRRAMGNVTLAREDARDAWLIAWIDRAWRDAKYGVRGLRHEPAIALAALLTLALGVVAPTDVF